MTGATDSNYLKPQILSVATAVPEQQYSQQQLAQLLNIKNEKALRFFNNKHIETRHLVAFDQISEQKNSALLEKFKQNSIKLSTQAIEKALQNIKLKLSDIDYICCVTSTGFIVPALSTLLVEHLNLNAHCEKTDIVGMGCSAGLNGLSAVNNWCLAHPDKNALLICCEISSAIYCLDETENSALVNSLFADGVAVAVVSLATSPVHNAPHLIKFTSLTAKNTLPYLRFDWNDAQNRYQFFIGKETPDLLGANIQKAIDYLLKDGPAQNEIKHWILHSGGTAILDKVEKQLSLNSTDLRHTRSVLKKYGNVSSGSFLFTYKELLSEKSAKKNENGIMVTMGPGLTIETALIRW
ncbi:type III polyketide synthase [bacterium]|nr:type III polyketide synthase [bacterium]